MAKILQFPTKEEKQTKDDTQVLNKLSDDCVDSSHFLLEVLEEFISTGEVKKDFMEMDFRDETKQESRDMFVVVNMLNAMFNRWYNIPHGLHQTMDNAYIKIKEMIILNEEANHELAEFVFEPEDSDIEFTFTPEDPENNDTD
tara:strand:- start:314 stop:742 length:429 start_codon:yes stop_codon:yes gene_type:complete